MVGAAELAEAEAAAVLDGVTEDMSGKVNCSDQFDVYGQFD